MSNANTTTLETPRPAPLPPATGSEAACKDCGRKMRPAPARRDGEETTVGYFPCECSWTYYNNHIAGQGLSYEDYRETLLVAKPKA